MSTDFFIPTQTVSFGTHNSSASLKTTDVYGNAIGLMAPSSRHHLENSFSERQYQRL